MGQAPPPAIILATNGFPRVKPEACARGAWSLSPNPKINASRKLAKESASAAGVAAVASPVVLRLQPLQCPPRGGCAWRNAHSQLRSGPRALEEPGWQREGTLLAAAAGISAQAPALTAGSSLGGGGCQCEPDAPNSPAHVSLTSLPRRRPEIAGRAVPSPAPRCVLGAHCPRPPGFGASGRLSPPLAALANGEARPIRPAPPRLRRPMAPARPARRARTHREGPALGGTLGAAEQVGASGCGVSSGHHQGPGGSRRKQPASYWLGGSKFFGFSTEAAAWAPRSLVRSRGERGGGDRICKARALLIFAPGAPVVLGWVLEVASQGSTGFKKDPMIKRKR